MPEILVDVLSVLGIAATCLLGALAILVLALATKIIRDTRKS